MLDVSVIELVAPISIDVREKNLKSAIKKHDPTKQRYHQLQIPN
jgi:hypothetical protein